MTYDETTAELLRENERLKREVTVRRDERDQERARVESAVKLLTEIHSLMYPAPLKMDDGSTMVFRPKSVDPHEVLQELSDRIRALPDRMAQAGISVSA